MGFEIAQFSLSLPFGIGSVKIDRTEAQRPAAWSLYVEYATRIATQRLDPGTGSVREALSSLHELFDITRQTLKEHGPSAADGPHSIGPLAIRVLNQGVRPFLVEWHGKLDRFETEQRTAPAATGADRAPVDESEWSERGAFYTALATFQRAMDGYVQALATLAGLDEGERAHAE